jgi:hypothetical protein
VAIRFINKFLCVSSGIFSKLDAYLNAVGVARKHFVNWPELVISAFLGRSGVFKARSSGTVYCDAKTLLKKIVRIEHIWRLYGDTLPPIRFEDDPIVFQTILEEVSEYLLRWFPSLHHLSISRNTILLKS